MAVDQLYQAAKMKAVYRGRCEVKAAGKEVKAACMILPTTFRKCGMGADEYSSAPIPHFLIGLKKKQETVLYTQHGNRQSDRRCMEAVNPEDRCVHKKAAVEMKRIHEDAE